MDVLAVYNAKGGVGKSTTAVNLAGALAEAGKRVLVVDLDAQGSATMALGVRDDGRTLAEALTGRDPLPIVQTSTSGVEVVPSGLALAGAERLLARELGAEMILRDKLARIAGYDLAILDCAPGLGVLSVGALAAAAFVLVPVQPNVMALGGLAGMLQALETIRERLNPRLVMSGILLTMVDRRTGLAREVEEDLRHRFESQILATVIRRTVKLEEAVGHGQTALAYATDSTAAEDYRGLAVEMAGRMKPPLTTAAQTA